MFRNLVTVFLVLFVSCQQEQKPHLESVEYSGQVTVDGDLSDWPDGLKQVEVKDREIYQGDLPRELSDNKMNVKSCWNDEYLFLGFRVVDTHLNAIQQEHDHAKLFLDDMVEVLLDVNYDRSSAWLADDLVYHINILNTVKDDRGTAQGVKDVAWDGKTKHAVKIYGTVNDDRDKDEGYVVEVAVPWEELGLKPKEGKILGLNFANGDNDGKGRQLYDWVGAWPMRSPNQFGQLLIVEKP